MKQVADVAFCCSSCYASLQARIEQAGMWVACRRCRQQVAVPVDDRALRMTGIRGELSERLLQTLLNLDSPHAAALDALTALRKLGHPCLSRAIADRLRMEYNNHRLRSSIARDCIDALGEIHDAESIAALGELTQGAARSISLHHGLSEQEIARLDAEKSELVFFKAHINHAIECLCKIPNPAVVQPLVCAFTLLPYLNDAAAIQKAILAFSEQAVGLLLPALESESATIRIRVAELLGMLGDIRAGKALLKTLVGDPEWPVRERAAGALIRLRMTPVKGPYRVLLGLFTGFTPSESDIGELRRLLADRHAEIRLRVIEALHAYFTAHEPGTMDVAIDRAMAELFDSDPDGLYWVRLKAVGFEPTNGRQRALVAVFENRYQDAAAEGEVALAPLLKVLSDHKHKQALDTKKVDALVEAIGALGRVAVPELLRRIRSEKPYGYDNPYAELRALNAISHPRADEALLQLFDEGARHWIEFAGKQFHDVSWGPIGSTPIEPHDTLLLASMMAVKHEPRAIRSLLNLTVFPLHAKNMVNCIQRILESAPARTALDDLRAIERLADPHNGHIKSWTTYGDDGPHELSALQIQGTVDCSTLRNLARNELQRRSSSATKS